MKKSLSATKQGTQTLVCYYNEFKTLWDEHHTFRPILNCSCGALNTCTCELPNLMAKSQDQDAVMTFLIELHDYYSSIRSQFLLNAPLPPLAKVYSLLLQEESQRKLNSPPANHNE